MTLFTLFSLILFAQRWTQLHVGDVRAVERRAVAQDAVTGRDENELLRHCEDLIVIEGIDSLFFQLVRLVADEYHARFFFILFIIHEHRSTKNCRLLVVFEEILEGSDNSA